MNEKKVSKFLRLKDNHPTMVKLNKLYALAEDLGIHISFGHNATVVQDDERDSNLPALIMADMDDVEPIQEWPPVFEFKVYYDNPEYLAEEKAKFSESQKLREAADAKRRAELKDAEEAERKRRALELENKERAELSRLKNKYER